MFLIPFNQTSLSEAGARTSEGTSTEIQRNCSVAGHHIYEVESVMPETAIEVIKGKNICSASFMIQALLFKEKMEFL